MIGETEAAYRRYLTETYYVECAIPHNGLLRFLRAIHLVELMAKPPFLIAPYNVPNELA